MLGKLDVVNKYDKKSMKGMLYTIFLFFSVSSILRIFFYESWNATVIKNKIHINSIVFLDE